MDAIAAVDLPSLQFEADPAGAGEHVMLFPWRTVIVKGIIILGVILE